MDGPEKANASTKYITSLQCCGFLSRNLIGLDKADDMI